MSVQRMYVRWLWLHWTDKMKLSKNTGLSQSLFALALGVTPMTVRNWEQGRIEPRGVATRVLDLIEADSSIVERYVSK